MSQKNILLPVIQCMIDAILCSLESLKASLDLDLNPLSTIPAASRVEHSTEGLLPLF